MVAKSKTGLAPAEPFATQLRQLTKVAIPTLGALNDLIHNPAGTGDLTTLPQQTPALAQLAATAFPQLIQAMNDSQAQLDYLREYTPDVVAALTNVGQASGYYDANGHYVADQPTFFAFGIDSSNQLSPQPPSDRYKGLQVVTPRCPGGAVQPAPDGSSPVTVPGCKPSSTPARTMRRMRDSRHRARCSWRPRRSPRWRARRGGTGGDPYDVRAIFDDAAFAVQGEEVRIAGAPVGSIASLDACTAAGNAGRGHARDRRLAVHAVPRQRDLRDPPAVADRREVRRLRPGHRGGAGADEDPHRPRQGRLLPAGHPDQLAGRLRHRPGHLPGADPRSGSR